jgi:hypothetical protein
MRPLQAGFQVRSCDQSTPWEWSVKYITTKRNGRAPIKSTPKTNRVNEAYQFPPFPQPLSKGEVKFRDPFHQQDERRCVSCSPLELKKGVVQ